MPTDIKLGDNAYAVTFDPELGWNLYIPQLNEEADNMDAMGAALVATFMRLQNDEVFTNEQLDWLNEQANKNDTDKHE